MTPERWRQVRAIFDDAVECTSASRAELIRQRCGNDQELQSEVESLLASDRETAHFLKSPLSYVAARSSDDPLMAIGPAAVLPERYEVLGELGRGGMGIVYKARDRETGEVLALKILKPEIAADLQTLERFKNELRLAHKITHRNVARLYEFHRARDAVYLSMEYVEGETLRTLLRRTGKLDVATGLDMARQLAAGLAEAHRQSIAHRDLKPENIMLAAGGELKVMDFGICRSYGVNVTATGGVIGTPAYMAPEQATGGSADHRTDIYAFGLIIYEMFTGAAAFSAETPLALALKQIRERPQAPRTLAPELPAHMEQAIFKCLEKDPADRFQSVEGLLNALEGGPLGNAEQPRKRARIPAPQATSKTLLAVVLALIALVAAGAFWLGRGGKSSQSSGDKASIAVLPFADNSPEKNQEYFADGLTEELLNALASIPGLRVAGRTSSSQFKGKTQDFRDIGKKLNVATILEGSVGRQGNRAKVTTRLVKASDGFLIWSATYDKEMGDIFAVQEEIGRAVSGALKIPLLTGKVSTPSAKSTNNEAYTAYLQGRYFLSKSSTESRANAVSYFGQATRLDSVYAPAWVGLGESLIKQVGSGEAPGPEGYRKAREAVERALMLDPNLCDAHEAMGDIKLLVDWDWSGAEASYQRALALKPSDASALGGIGSLARILGRLDEAARLYNRVIEIEPLLGHYNLGLILHYAGRQEEARAACAKSLELDPERAAARVLLVRIYLAQAHRQEALREAEKVNHPAWRPFGLALAYHASGRKEESDLKLAELIQFPGGASFLVAEVYAYRGESDQAFVWLERAYTERDTGLEEMKADPLLAGLRNDPRYRALLKKMRLPV